MLAKRLVAFIVGFLSGGIVVGGLVAAAMWYGAIFVGPQPAQRHYSYRTVNGAMVISALGFSRWTHWINGGWEWVPTNEIENRRSGLFALWNEQGAIDEAASGQFVNGDRGCSLNEASASEALATEPPPIVFGEYSREGYPVGAWTLFDAAGKPRLEAVHSPNGFTVKAFHDNGSPRCEGWYDLIDGPRGKWTYWDASGRAEAVRDLDTDVFTWFREDGSAEPGRRDPPELPDCKSLWQSPYTDFEDATLRLGLGSD